MKVTLLVNESSPLEYRAIVTFGLNAPYGRTVKSGNLVVGDWNSSNAESLLRYTVNKGYPILGWELGELMQLLCSYFLRKEPLR